jgi:hypothetical protein
LVVGIQKCISSLKLITSNTNTLDDASFVRNCAR